MDPSAPPSTPNPAAAAASNKDSSPLPAGGGSKSEAGGGKKLQKSGSSTEAPDDGKGVSRSSSSASLNHDVIASEGVNFLYFADSYPRKNDFNSLGSCLWVGTDLGSLIAVIIALPDRGESRTEEPVVVSPSNSLFR